MIATEWIARLTAIANPHRFRILATLSAESLHVSELARRLGMSRALLYMHLQRLEEEGYVVGHLELSDTGKALKYFEAVPFDLALSLTTLTESVRTDPELTLTPDTAEPTPEKES